MNIKERVLIAKFMGYIDNGDSEFLIHPETNYDHSIKDKDWFKYDTDLVWLNQVTDKIEEILFKNIEKFGYSDECLFSEDLETKYIAVVEFINWYNNLK